MSILTGTFPTNQPGLGAPSIASSNASRVSPNLLGGSPSGVPSTAMASPTGIGALAASQLKSSQAAQTPQAPSYLDQATAQYQQTLAQSNALLKSLAPGNAATINTNAIKAQAQSAANNAVNPLYTQYLNEYLQGSAAEQQTAQAQNQMNIENEQTTLGNTLAQNQLAQNQAGNTNALTQGNINAQQQNYELQSGNAQNAKLDSIQASIGSGNLGASGLGQQKIYAAENARNTADAAQRGQLQYQRDASNLSTQDTFAQLAQSSQQAVKGEGQQEAQTNFNLNDYLRQAAAHDQSVQDTLEQTRQQALTAQTQNFTAQGLQNQINSLGLNGKDLTATNQVYSPYLQTTAAPNFDTSILDSALKGGSAV